MPDPIIEEIWKLREEHAARFNFDVDAIFEDFKRIQKERGLPTVTLPPNRIQPRESPHGDGTDGIIAA